MRFKTLSRPRAWLLGTAWLVATGLSVSEYVGIARRLVSPAVQEYMPLIILAGFVCALFVVGTAEDHYDREASLVIGHQRQFEEDEEHGSYPRDYLTIRNVGYAPLTKLAVQPFRLLQVSVRPERNLEAIMPGAAEEKVAMYGLEVLIRKAWLLEEQKPITVGRARAPIRLKLTVQCEDWRQREQYVLEYALLSYGKAGRIEVKRVHPGEEVAWTHFDSNNVSHTPEAT